MANAFERRDRAHPLSHSLCINCNEKPRNNPYEFCSQECGRMCFIPGCTQTKHPGSLYCSQEHRREAVVKGLVPSCSLCDFYPKLRGSLFCGRVCKDKAADAGITDCEDDTDDDTDDESDGLEVVRDSGSQPAIPLSDPVPPPPQSPPRPASSSQFESPSEVTSLPSVGASTTSLNSGGWDKRVPRPPHIRTKPRSAYQISFGEYGDRPSFLLRSKKGLVWANLPPALERLCKQPSMSEHTIVFSLGTKGRFYFVFRYAKEVKIETSTNLWADMNSDFKGGSIIQMQFGAGNTIWGLRSYRHYKEDSRDPVSLVSSPSSNFQLFEPSPYSTFPITPLGRVGTEDVNADIQTEPFSHAHWAASKPSFRHSKGPGPPVRTGSPAPSTSSVSSRQTSGRIKSLPAEPPYTVKEEPFGSVPSSMIAKLAEIYPQLTHYGQVDFAALGMGGSWVIGLLGKLCFWNNIEPHLMRHMTKVYADGGDIRNVVLSPTSPSIYLLETVDGHVKYWVPDEWFPKIRSYLTPEHAMDHLFSNRRGFTDQTSVTIKKNIIEREKRYNQGPESGQGGHGRGRGSSSGMLSFTGSQPQIRGELRDGPQSPKKRLKESSGPATLASLPTVAAPQQPTQVSLTGPAAVSSELGPAPREAPRDKQMLSPSESVDPGPFQHNRTSVESLPVSLRETVDVGQAILSNGPTVQDLGDEIIFDSPLQPFDSRGSFCDLFLGTHQKAGKVALKRLRRQGGAEDEMKILERHFQLETEVWMDLRHERILKCLGTFKRDGYLYMVSPFMKNGSLFDWLRSGKRGGLERLRLIRELADAIVYLHLRGIVHGDVKAHNILISDNQHVQLCDFGLTKLANSGTTLSLKGAGSVRWQSFELLNNEPKSLKSDVYAFAMTIVEVLTGQLPFSNIGADIAVIAAVYSKDQRPDRAPEKSPDGTSYLNAWTVAERCWSRDIKDRITMEQATDILDYDGVPHGANQPDRKGPGAWHGTSEEPGI